VFAFFGLVATAGSRLVHDGASPAWVWLLGVPVGMLAAAILVANNLRDIETDARVGKKTLAVLIGAPRTRWLYRCLVWGSLVVTTVLAVTGVTPTATLISLLAVVLLPRLNSIVEGNGTQLIPLLAGTARLHLVFGLLLSTGIVVARAFK
jgi:1,4-dihydroxy-2-naphthoate octaprenyltransferase